MGRVMIDSKNGTEMCSGWIDEVLQTVCGGLRISFHQARFVGTAAALFPQEHVCKTAETDLPLVL